VECWQPLGRPVVPEVYIKNSGASAGIDTGSTTLSALAYVPSAALVVRRAAVGGGFAPELRNGEDVDLCLRLHRAGWRMRYVPSSRVGHRHRDGLPSWLAQRASYGAAAAELARRHPGQVPPLNAAPWSVAACALVLAGRPARLGLAAVLTGWAAIRLSRRIPDADTPLRAGVLLALAAVRGTAQQLTRCATRHYWPAAAVAGVMSRRARHVLITAAAIEAMIDYRRSGARLDPLTYLLIHRLDDLAYGTGLWRGALRDRTAAPLIPRLAPCARHAWRPGPATSAGHRAARPSTESTGSPKSAGAGPAMRPISAGSATGPRSSAVVTQIPGAAGLQPGRSDQRAPCHRLGSVTG
jgi:mycofactocin glycosyltransferase